MSKSATAKKAKPRQPVQYANLHDIINKVKDGHQKADQKLAELAQMCAPKGTKG